MRAASGGLSGRCLPAATGSVVGSLLCGSIGTHSGQTALGAIAGLILGGIVGHGAGAGWIGRATVGAALMAAAACAVGPAVDDYGGNTAIPAAILGGLLARLGWLPLLAIVGAIVGLSAAAAVSLLVPGLATGPVYLGGLALGAAIGSSARGRRDA